MSDNTTVTASSQDLMPLLVTRVELSGLIIKPAMVLLRFVGLVPMTV